MIISVASLQVGQEVAIARNGNWNMNYQGVYVVTKSNKMKVTLARKGDNYERVFSVKRNCELPKTAGGYVDRYLTIVSVAQMEADQARRQAEARVNGMWREMVSAAEHKNVAKIEELLALLK